MDFQMVFGQSWSDFFELADNAPQSVAVLPTRHQDRIVGGHHHYVVNAEQRDQVLLACDI